MKNTTIYHAGGWHKNYGDFAIQNGMMQELNRLSTKPLTWHPINTQLIKFTHDVIADINANADMLIIGGGGMIMDREGDNTSSGWQFNIELPEISHIRVPIVVYGIGWNKFPYDTREWKASMGDHLYALKHYAKLFSVRDEGTKDRLIKEFNLGQTGITVIPDPAMFLSPNDMYVRGKVKPDDKVFRIGLNIAGDRPDTRFADKGQKDRFFNMLATRLKDFEQEILGGVLYDTVALYNIPHLPGDEPPLSITEYWGDRYFDIQQMFPELYPPTPSGIASLAGVYKSMDLVLGMRKHSNIISFGVGTPFVGLGDHPANAFFRDQITGLLCGNELKGLRKAMVDATCLSERHTTWKARLAELHETATQFNMKILRILGVS